MKKTRFTAAVLFLCMLLAACGLFRASDTPNTRNSVAAPLPQYRGVNLTGGDVAYGVSNTTTPVSGTDYLFVSHQDIDYLSSKGITFARLVFSWEIMQPTLNGPLASTGNTGAYLTAYVDRVNYLTSKGIYVLVEPHGASDTNFVRYKGNLVGSTQVPNSAFADFWSRMAVLFKANPKVMYGLSNEPHDMSTMQWYAGAQAAITAIRAAGATQQIFVAGNGWSQPSSWNDNWYDTAATKVSNATGWSTLSDPANNLVVSVHTYFDANSGGGADDIAGPNIIATRLQPVVDWARAKGFKVHLSEFGAKADAPGAQVAVTNALTYMNNNSDVIEGWAWWAYGPPTWWGGYRFTLDPTSNYTVDDPKMAWLKPFFAAPVVDAGVPDSGSATKPTNPIAFTKNAKGTIVVNGVTSWIFVPTSYDSTHNTPTKLFVWLHGCGGQSQYDADMVSWMPNQSWITLAVGGRETTCWSNYATDGAKVLEAIAAMKTYFNVDPKRVFYGGYSSGGDIGYELVFKNANLFAGALFENTGPSTAALTASTTAAWKLNIAHLAHLQDTTYPIATTRTKMVTLRTNGFPVTLIEKTGGHYDNDSGQTGTQYDLRTFLLPYIDAGWVAGGTVAPPVTDAGVDSGPVDAGTVDSGSVDAGVDSGIVDAGVDSGADAGVPLQQFVVSAVKTYDWGTGYCKQYYFTNPNTVSRNWKTMTIYLNDGKLRGPTAVWGAVFPSSSATGKVIVTPSGDATVLAGQKLQTVGFCADYGPTKYVGTNGGLTY